MSTLYEIKSERTRNAKVYDLGNGKRRASCSVQPVHFPINIHDHSKGMENIDRTIYDNGDGTARSGANSYMCDFFQDYSCRFKRGGKWFDMMPTDLFWRNAAGETEIINEPLPNKTFLIDNKSSARSVVWPGLFGPGLDFGYFLQDGEFRKALVIQDFASLPTPTINADGLELVLFMTFQWDAEPGIVLPDGVTEDAELIENGVDKIEYLDDQGRRVWSLTPPRAWDSWQGEQQVHDCDACNKLCLKYDTGENLRLYPLQSQADQNFMDRYPRAWHEVDGAPYMVAPSPLLDENDNWNVDADCIPMKSFKGDWKCLPECVVSHYYPLLNMPQEQRDGCWATEAREHNLAANHAVPLRWAVVKNGSTFFGEFAVSYETLSSPYPIYPIYVDTSISEEEVPSGADDAWIDGSTFYGTDTYIRVGTDDMAWVRFTSVPVPQGATIDYAGLTMMTIGVDGSGTVLVTADDTDDAPQRTTRTGISSDYTPTSLAHNSFPTITLGQDNTYDDGGTYPDLHEVVQLVTDRPGWASGNAMAFRLSSASKVFNRDYASYENLTYAPPRLNIDYTAASPPSSNQIGEQIIVTT